MDKVEEDQIIQAKIDPDEWKREVERVYQDLDNIEKDVLLIRQRGTGELSDDIEECRRHIELIIELCTDVKNTCHSDVRKVFAKASELLQEDLAYIRKHEIRINNNNAKDILHLNGITQTKKQLAGELRGLIEVVKRLDYECKNI